MSCLNRNCCDGIYNSFDVHFTGACDNKCAHCIDRQLAGVADVVTDPEAIANTIIKHKAGFEDVLFLGGEPFLYMEELSACITMIQRSTDLKVYVTTALPKNCYDKPELLEYILLQADGVNISVQHHDEAVADKIRGVPASYDRQKFYEWLPYKNKIRVNLNLVKPYLSTKQDIIECLRHYDSLGFRDIKLNELQHAAEHYVSFEDAVGIKLPSPYAHGCQGYIDLSEIGLRLMTPVLLKRSCFLCEGSRQASLLDGAKALYKAVAPKRKSNFGVVYADGTLKKGWV